MTNVTDLQMWGRTGWSSVDCRVSLSLHQRLVLCRVMRGLDGLDLHLTHYLTDRHQNRVNKGRVSWLKPSSRTDRELVIKDLDGPRHHLRHCLTHTDRKKVSKARFSWPKSLSNAFFGQKQRQSYSSKG